MKVPLFYCMECKKKFFTVKSAEKAAYYGCPKCGGGDIEIWPESYAVIFKKFKEGK
jgi:Zn finger protein HypA/HybF involved in hydrogenase expression